MVQNISQQGLLEPIMLFEGKILDGFHRDEACYAAGKPSTYVELDPDLDAFEFVFGKNMERRQMTVSQISVVMAKGATLTPGRRWPKSSSNKGKPEISKIAELENLPQTDFNAGKHAPVKTVSFEDAVRIEDGDASDAKDSFYSPIAVTRMEPPEPEAVTLTTAQAAKIAGVSSSSIVTAKRLISANNELLLDAVMQHGMSNGHALSLLTLPEDDQIHAVHDFVQGKKEGEKRKVVKADAKKAVEKSKKVNGGIDVTGVVPGESPLSTVLRAINGLEWAIGFFKHDVPNEELQRRYDRLLARARALVDNDQNVKKILLVN